MHTARFEHTHGREMRIQKLNSETHAPGIERTQARIHERLVKRTVSLMRWQGQCKSKRDSQ